MNPAQNTVYVNAKQNSSLRHHVAFECRLDEWNKCFQVTYPAPEWSGRDVVHVATLSHERTDNLHTFRLSLVSLHDLEHFERAVMSMTHETGSPVTAQIVPKTMTWTTTMGLIKGK